MTTEIYDPENPNLYGYRPYRKHSFIERHMLGLCFWLYGPGIVAWHLHREQSALGRLMNLSAGYILRHL